MSSNCRRTKQNQNDVKDAKCIWSYLTIFIEAKPKQKKEENKVKFKENVPIFRVK
jgi:hypothetical protein